MEKVKRLVAAGGSLAAAVKDALADKQLTVADVAERHDGVVREQLSAVINLRLVPQAPHLAALSTELGGTPEEWLALWWSVASPLPAKSKAAHR